MARLDRVCATSEWLRLYPVAIVRHLLPNSSDHIPILLDEGRGKKRDRAMFRFINFWASGKIYLHLVERNWNAHSDDSATSLQELLERKFNDTKGTLQNWHRSKFRDLDDLNRTQYELKEIFGGRSHSHYYNN